MVTEEQRDELRAMVTRQLTGIYRSVRTDVDEALVARAYSDDPTDEAEEGTIDQLATELDEQTVAEVHRLEEALDRMRRPDYGRCIDCGEEIPFARLKVAPWAERCLEDEDRQEQILRVRDGAPPTM
jgi:RNA polymerase-binding transcription factor DksA